MVMHAGNKGFVELSIRDVRCFGPEQTLPLAGPDGEPVRWTILLGENGVGKTTLLQALALLCMDMPLDFLFYEEWGPEQSERDWTGFSRSSAKSGGRIRGIIRGFGDTPETEHTIEIGSKWRFDIEPSRPRETQLFVCGYGASRRLGEGRLRRKRSGRSSIASLFLDAPLRDGEDWMLRADYGAAKETEGSARTLDVVKDLLVRVLPDTKAVRLGRTGRTEWPAVELKTPYGWVPMRGLSLGYQTLIAWMVDLASRFFERYPDSKDPLAESAVVLVDEIDLHLHPRWQRSLIGYLTERFPQTQFIATAHSPLVVQAASEANVVLLKRQGDHVVIERQPESVRNWRVDQILTSDLYGLPSARPPHLDTLIEERRELLTKPELSRADRARLRVVERKIGDLPGGETPEEQRAMDLIVQASRKIAAGGRKKT